MKTAKNIWAQLANYLAGELNADEQREFLESIRNHPELNHDVETMKQTWKQFSTDPAEKYRDTGKAWNRLREKIADEGMESEPETVDHPSLRYRLYRAAAMIALLLAVGIPTLYLAFSDRGDNDKIIRHHASEGVLTVDLPDGSRVFLNEGAGLDYDASFPEQREVSLRGEGYFDVMSDPKRPFRVNAGKVIVTVLGTSFNVKEEVESNEVEVFVESGSVEVTLPVNNQSVMLKPGDLARAAERVEVEAQSDDNYLSWKTRKFKFVDESVKEILDVLERSYHVDVVTDGVPLEEMRLTTTYDEQSFDAILETICAALNLNYDKEGKVYILHSN